MGAASLDYTAAGVPIREDLRAAHALVLDHFSRPGSWFTGSERMAIAARVSALNQCFY